MFFGNFENDKAFLSMQIFLYLRLFWYFSRGFFDEDSSSSTLLNALITDLKTLLDSQIFNLANIVKGPKRYTFTILYASVIFFIIVFFTFIIICINICANNILEDFSSFHTFHHSAPVCRCRCNKHIGHRCKYCLL